MIIVLFGVARLVALVVPDPRYLSNNKQHVITGFTFSLFVILFGEFIIVIIGLCVVARLV